MKKRITALALALVMALALTAPALAARINTSNMPGHEVLSELPDAPRRPARPATLEQAGFSDSHEAWTFAQSREEVFQEIVELTDSLTAGKSTDTQKIKAIYDWVSQNVMYDDRGEGGGALFAYAGRRAVCEGYADLCRLMGTIAGIPVADFGGMSNSDVQKSGPHGWNAAFADGKWIFFDATWKMWDMAPDYHDETGDFYCYEDIFELKGFIDMDGSPTLIMTLRPGFECSGSLVVPSGVTQVTNFYDNPDLTEVVLSDTVTLVGGFGRCTGLTKVTIPNGVTTIDNSAFNGCTSLKSVTLPDSVTTIDYGAFNGCTALESVTIPGSVTQIGTAAFNGCSGLKRVTIGSGVSAVGDLAFMDCTGLTDVTIPGTVATIGRQAFMGCTSLEAVTIPEGVTTIQDMAFLGCTSLKRADIPDSVTSLGNSVFTNCPLQSTSIPAGMTSIGVGAFQDRTDLTSFTIPDHITEIGDRAFYGCSNLQSVTIPDSVTTIGNSAFWGCSGLTEVTIPASVTTIEYGAFAGCTGLTSLTIPECVTRIGNMATPNTLTSLTVPASVTSIGDYIFGGHMKDVYYAGTEEQWNAISFGKSSLRERVTVHYNSTAPALPSAGKIAFSDVPAGAYYEDAVSWAVEQGITNGTSDTAFSPNATCTTAQILTFLWRAKGSPEPASGLSFSDISSGDYYYKAALWAKEKGLVTGDTFHGNTPCTRSATVTYLWKLAGSPAASGSSFQDVPSGADYAPAVAWAVENGVTSGTSETAFSPDATCTRGQIVTFLHRDLAK